MITRGEHRTATAPQTSRWKLCLQAYVALMAAVVFGVLASTPFLYSRVRCYKETTYLVENFPPDETAIKDWALSESDVVSFKTERRGMELWVRSEHQSLTEQPPQQHVILQLRILGYGFRGIRGGSTGMATSLAELITDARILAVMLAGMQVAFGCVGLIMIRRAMRNGEPLPPMFLGSLKRAATIGVAGGLVLLGTGLLYDFALRALFGHSPPSPWDSTNAMPPTTKLVFLFFGGLGAPVTEEIFFRGYVFGRFKAAGYVWLGLLVSSMLFGIVHFSDPYSVPAICFYGVLLAWMYHRTGSLLTSITAHAVNNGVLIVYMVFS